MLLGTQQALNTLLFSPIPQAFLGSYIVPDPGTFSWGRWIRKTGAFFTSAHQGGEDKMEHLQCHMVRVLGEA
jgi:hypothetical protein